MTVRQDRRSLLTVALAAALFLLLLAISRRPDISGLGPLALIAVLLVAASFYQALEAIRALRRRTRLTIAGILSDGRPRDRNEVAREVGRRIPALRYPPLRWLRLPDQGLAEMTRRGLLALHDGKYSSTEPRGIRLRS